MTLNEKIDVWARSYLWLIPKERIKQAEFSLSNAACHFNAVSAFRAGRADSVWLVWAGGEKGVVHFINSKDGKFFDETWHDWEDQSYRVIRKIHPHEHDDVYEILCDVKRDMVRNYGTLWQRIRMLPNNLHGVI